jgi:hypothetical protein
MEISEAERLVLIMALQAYDGIVKKIEQDRMAKHIASKPSGRSTTMSDRRLIESFEDFYAVEAIVIQRLLEKLRQEGK